MAEIKKSRSLPMKAKLNKIPITRRPVGLSCEEKQLNREYARHRYKTNSVYRETLLKNCKHWASVPENKIRRNIRQRLRRYKVKLNTQLIQIWSQRGLIAV